MNEIKTGGPAFPSNHDNEYGYPAKGMTLRDYFAAKALPAIYKDTCECGRVEGWAEGWRNEVAAEAYAIADAMLKARDA
jgi:hypothetical protein